MKNIVYILLFQAIFSCLCISAQERPPINIFSPSDYGGEPQNWSITQAENRYVYVANNKGLLEYNGAKWTLYPSPNETIIRAVSFINGLIYTGSYHEFGYWKKDDYGVLNYNSLSKELNVEFLEDEEFWNILHYENVILFQSLDRIHIYNVSSKVYNTVDFKENITKLFKVDSDFYFQSLNNGIYKIESGKPVLTLNEEVFKDNPVVNIFKHNGKLLVLTQDRGFYTLDDSEVIPWDIPSKELLSDVSVFSAVKLKDNGFALGTISDGIIHLTENGDIDFHIAQINGLSNNTILSIHEDVDNNLWLGLDNGINCINIVSPYNIYHDKSGVIGSLYTSVVYKGMLYLGTNQGLFYKPKESDENYEFIQGTQGQVWFLGVFDDKLFCGHNFGTFIIDGQKATKISNIQGTWQIKTIEDNQSLLVQGNYDGLYILQNSDSKWQLRNKIEGFDISSRFFEFLNNKEIAVSHEYKGVYRLKLNDELTRVLSFEKDINLEKSQNSSLVKHGEQILYSNRQGVFKYNEKRDVFEKDSLRSGLLNVNNFTSAKLVSEPKTNTLWGFSSKGINYLTAAKLSGEMKIDTVPFPEIIRKDVIGFESVTHIKDQQFLLGSKSGYIILDLDKTEKQDHEINIDQISVRKLKDNSTNRLVKINETPEFEDNENNIIFSYSITEFLKTQQPEYQYKLDGRHENWSEWTTNGSVLFENLPYGYYTFLVRGRVGNQLTLNNATYKFSINRPWFLSNIAIGAYVLAILLFSVFMHHVYKRYYKNQQERLLQKTTREFELKELENKQQLMRFRNDKLREDIETKNRELGISTMNLIKKNEFLSTIKSELEDIDDAKNLRKVIKIIDRNLNNNDDWNLFQEAFNNADKDFLKKIKSIHPSLTSNDLRLCAYLRLNLSSKEIAPLLNISPRSVEVKRYRLRKKMELPHESSLSDYILEI